MFDQLDMLGSEIKRVTSINRNRETLMVFVDAVKNSLYGQPGYIYTQRLCGTPRAEEQRQKCIERLKRACLRADVDFEMLCREHQLFVQ